MQAKQKLLRISSIRTPWECTYLFITMASKKIHKSPSNSRTYMKQTKCKLHPCLYINRNSWASTCQECKVMDVKYTNLQPTESVFPAFGLHSKSLASLWRSFIRMQGSFPSPNRRKGEQPSNQISRYWKNLESVPKELFCMLISVSFSPESP